MSAVFIDTSFFIALLRTTDQFHIQAMAWARRSSNALLTTDYVLLEFMDAFSYPVLRRRGLQGLAVVRSNPDEKVLSASRQLMDEGLAVLDKHRDKAWSLTDCISFAVMNSAGITAALTTDRHFEQAGFRALLRMEPG